MKSAFAAPTYREESSKGDFVFFKAADVTEDSPILKFADRIKQTEIHAKSDVGHAISRPALLLENCYFVHRAANFTEKQRVFVKGS